MAMGLEQNISSFSTLESALQSVQDFQNETNSKFVMIKKRKAAVEFSKNKIRFEEPYKAGILGPVMQYDGVPFVVRSSIVMECQYGRDQKRARSLRNADKKIKNKRSKKHDCRATIVIREITKFPKFQIDKDTSSRRSFAAKILRSAMSTNPSLVMEETSFIVKYPNEEDHKNHITNEANQKAGPSANIKHLSQKKRHCELDADCPEQPHEPELNLDNQYTSAASCLSPVSKRRQLVVDDLQTIQQNWKMSGSETIVSSEAVSDSNINTDSGYVVPTKNELYTECDGCHSREHLIAELCTRVSILEYQVLHLQQKLK